MIEGENAIENSEDSPLDINTSGHAKSAFDHITAKMAVSEDMDELASLYVERIWCEFQMIAHEAANATGKDVQWFMNAFGQTGRKRRQKKKRSQPILLVHQGKIIGRKCWCVTLIPITISLLISYFEDRAKGQRLKLTDASRMFRDDYGKVDSLQRSEFKGRLVKHRETNDDAMKNIRSGRALAWDVTHTMNSLKEEVSRVLSIPHMIIAYFLHS